MNKLEVIQKFNLRLEYKNNGHIDNINGISIHEDKHAYACNICGCIYQSKNLATRNLFFTEDKKTNDCEADHMSATLIQICDCDPIV